MAIIFSNNPNVLTVNWTTGSGGTTGFNQNGATAENERINATDPWGNNAVIWETRPTGDSGGDGGWETTWFNIDRTKLYRFSVWVKRTSSTAGGNFYLPDLKGRTVFGLNADNGDVDSRLDNDSASTTNRSPKHNHSFSLC